MSSILPTVSQSESAVPLPPANVTLLEQRPSFKPFSRRKLAIRSRDISDVTKLSELQFEARDEIGVMYPFLNVSDEDGSVHHLMLNKWLTGSQEDSFASFTIYGEMKLNEAKRMASWIETPNRFLTTACCILIEKVDNASFLS